MKSALVLALNTNLLSAKHLSAEIGGKGTIQKRMESFFGETYTPYMTMDFLLYQAMV
ncbi:hypothetical protein [Methylomicrobium sp. Wu6]|uniref:hypothetical protein n=1 Tax=Methylomicrobium sp. Wu6 TaxID=3107928 RepID=UPI002DD69F2A|nr:hypothetical protein [Methylomicrobium sp. Wu6]